jgi:hypothetical protein
VQQLPQFQVFQDKILTANMPILAGQDKPTTKQIQAKLSEKLLFSHIEIPPARYFRAYSSECSVIEAPKASIRPDRTPLSSLIPSGVNLGRKAPKIPQNWLQNQPNDHTSLFPFISSLFS